MMESVMNTPRLLLSNDGFYVLEERCDREAREAVLLLHGLGENRSGINYMFVEMSKAIRQKGFDVYRLDLAGLGESLLPLDVARWVEQVKWIIGQRRKRYENLHIVARSSGILAAPFDDEAVGTVIAIQPPRYHVFSYWMEQEMSEARNDSEAKIGREEFWLNLGVEPGLADGRFFSKGFFRQLSESIANIPYSRTVCITNGYTVPTDRLYLLTGADPLYRYQHERAALIRIILKEIL